MTNMSAASKYWTLVRIDATGGRKLQVIASAKAFFASAFPDAERFEVPDKLIQRQLLHWMHEENPTQEPERSLLAERCLLCFISWHIERVCLQLEAQFGVGHGFTCRDLLPIVLGDDGRGYQPTSPPFLAREILQSFELTQSGLATWTTRRTKHDKELNAFLLERGVYLVSDWAILNDTRPSQLERILKEFHHLTAIEISQARRLLESYHGVYRVARLQQRQGGSGGRCATPTTEQLQQIAYHLIPGDGEQKDVISTKSGSSQSPKPETVMAQLQQLASRLRQYQIHVRGGSQAIKPQGALDKYDRILERVPSPHSQNILAPEDDQTEFLQSYRQQFRVCLDAAVAQVTDARARKLRRQSPQKAEQFLTALQLFHCQGTPMGDIAKQVGLQAQYQVSRLLQLKPLRADIRQQLLVMLRDRVLAQAQAYTTPERLPWKARLKLH